MVRFFFFFLGLCSVFLFPARALAIEWKGAIYDADSRAPLQGVKVYNTTTHFFVFTDEKGFYEIHGKEGETVTFTCPGYKGETHLIIKGLEGIRLNFYMKFDSRELREVVVKQKYRTEYQRDSALRVSEAIKALEYERTGGIMSPFTFAAERLSKKQKQIYRFKKNFPAMEAERFIESRYTSELVSEMTGLQGDTLAYFMQTYPMAYDYARSATSLELKMWIRDNYKLFLNTTDSLRCIPPEE